ncbi:glycoside hydrolase family 71 protein [Crepidotus variabilis]|uniref:Glycoside hydrolase family 71 protein n=1 Tax=Crepidotus variabilis TaxID=179855 RepID=A0A9P6E3S9_9AGAR|nr:glycoside hydrolase family 71 protein [Crepidotus variabilis]
MLVTYLLFVAASLIKEISATAVFAHFMAQNSYSYSQADWANDINSAANIGIDGFALNIAANDYEVPKIDDAYAAAEAHGNFKLFYSFDLSYSWDYNVMATIVAKHANSSATYRWKNNVLVSTFSGEAQGDAWWAAFKNACKAKGVVQAFPSIDGFFNWWSWPDDTNTNLTTATDLAYQTAIKTRTGPYIMSVSPWQFKELGGGNNWVELSDTLWKYRWEQAINDVKPDIVEIVTWNDYGESHYISDINPRVDLGTLAPNYVNGFDHSPWRIIAQYYISWYKNGVAPKLTNDQVIFWYRAHPKNAVCSGGDVPRNSAYPVDAVFAMALLADSATISLDIGSKHAQWNASPGVSIGSVPFPPEDSQIPYIQIIKNGATAKSGYGSVYVTKSCSYYNFNPFVGHIST